MKVNGNKLRSAAPALLEASRAALKLLAQDSPSDATRQKVMKQLREAVDAAEDDCEKAGRIELVTTLVTADAIVQLVKKRRRSSDIAEKLHQTLRRSIRRTARRAYITLDIDIPTLREFCAALNDQPSYTHTRRATDRLMKQIEEEALNKSPLVLLAQQSL